uniref:uncharacterized protein LOC108951066 n=1 Tax=Ciona intestinalis TaxID=7719 RepID=UPI00089DD4A3|nr:uncharacterized protein LOC108951066 [Ciona intestinalis]|eukprot:XP_018673331.1 uncharacterized protein LOC108951066 [Ciona intestinalis]
MEANETIAAYLVELCRQKGCVHGSCIVRGNDTIFCECSRGFIGTRCEETYIDFSNKSQNKGSQAKVVGFAAVGIFLLLVLLIAMFAIWKRCTKNHHNRQWVRWQESRLQSRSTIEGSTFDSDVRELPLTINKKSIFPINLFRKLRLVGSKSHNTRQNVKRKETYCDSNTIATVSGTLPTEKQFHTTCN